MVEKPNQIESGQGFCCAQIHRQVLPLLLPSKIPIVSQDFHVEAWPAMKPHF